MITKKSILSKKKAISDLAQKSGISYVALFGSTARGEQTPASDIDLLVKFHPSKIKTMGLFELSKISNEFEDLFKSKVDLITKDGLKPLIYKYLKNDIKILYES
jgi:predicted nucleotidyltransferase